MNYLFSDLEYLYIHWPFCPYKCHFCDFVAMASHEAFMKDYHDALCKEIKQFHIEGSTSKKLKTIYMGGGTPSTYPSELLLDMFGILKEKFDFDESTEIVIEVNPGTVTTELLHTWKKVGINRLSIGVQSLKDQVLQSLNRHQKATDVYALLKEASELFENISVDFIVGLPDVSEDEWKQMIEQAMLWPIKHISVYFLMVQENTPLFFKVKSKKVVLPPDEATVELYHWLVEKLEQHGFYRYELSNFAKPGYESRHNKAYWDREPYKGFGLGACSFNGAVRFQNNKNLGKYLKAINSGESLVDTSEQLDDKQVVMEKMMLGLRQREGICIQTCITLLSEKDKQTVMQGVDELQKMNLIEHKGERIVLTPRGYVLENEVIVRLFP